MASERKWPAASQPFIANGTDKGAIAVADTAGFFVKAKVYLTSNTIPYTPTSTQLEVKKVEIGYIYVGRTDKDLNDRVDISAYLTADSAQIFQPEQQFPTIKVEDIMQAIYAREPIVALRNILVDKYGRFYDDNNPLPINAQFTGSMSVDLDALTPPTQANPDNVLIAGSDDGTKTGIKRAARVDSALDLRVGLSNGANKAAIDAFGQLAVKDSDAFTVLQAILAALGGTLSVSDSALATLIAAGNTILNNIYAQLTTGVTEVNDSAAQDILTDILSQLASGGMAIGTEDGTTSGTPHVFVNNLRQMILASHDRQNTITWLDINNKKNRRVDKIEYTSATFPGVTLRKQFYYSLVGSDYVPTTTGQWSVV